MYFPKYWAKNKQHDVLVWGWSDESREDAERRANDRAASIDNSLKHGGLSKSKRYEYGSRPFREEIIEEIGGGPGRAMVTRNSYGCLVLNTANVAFLDIDTEPEHNLQGGNAGSGFLARLFGKQKPDAAAERSGTTVEEKIEEFAGRNRETHIRLYKTAGGYRLLAAHRTYEPMDSDCKTFFASFPTDPLYVRLCINQKSFRARTSPKPWRCGVSAVTANWPFENSREEELFKKWLRKYDDRAKKFATCKLLGTFGTGPVLPEIAGLVNFHDRETKANEALPLA